MDVSLCCPICAAASIGEEPVLGIEGDEATCPSCGSRTRRDACGAWVFVEPRPGDPYESPEIVAEYMAFHYPDGDPLESILKERTPPVCSRHPFALPNLWAGQAGRALELGCAVGRTTFDLARDHAVALGIDACRALVREAMEVKTTRRAVYETIMEGDRKHRRDVAVEAPANAHFLVANALACPLPSRSFDTIVAMNLLDRVPDPARLIEEVERLARPGGIVILGSPFTWLETFTPRERWLGGSSASGLETALLRLEESFTLERTASLPFFIPHHARSGQLALTLVSILRRNP